MHTAITTIAPPLLLPTLAASLLAEYHDNPLALADVLVLLPTRRSCRRFQELLLEKAGGKPVILPTVHPMGEVEEDELLFTTVDTWNLPLPVTAPEQRLLLTRLIQQWQGSYQGAAGGLKPLGIAFDQASELAATLTRFLHEVEREQIPWDNLHNLVPEHYAQHWQTTLSFLEILSIHWPAILKGRNKISPVAYRNRLLASLTHQWEQHPPASPVIAAGIMGTIPATRQLLKVIAGLPKGKIILPGLDETSWEGIDVTHPQYGMKMLLEYVMGDTSPIGRGGFPQNSFLPEKNCDWKSSEDGVLLCQSKQNPHPKGEGAFASPRTYLLSELMRPAHTTHQWIDSNPDLLRQSLDGITLVEASTQHEEASIIALMMRESLETPGKRTVLVTEDRVLANRVKQWLKRWDIAVDDSAGEPFSLTPSGVFLLLLSEMVDKKIAPVPLLAVLRHPLCAMEAREYARELEIKALRGIRPKEGFGGIIARLKHKEGNAELVSWLQRIERHCQDFITLMAQGHAAFSLLLKAHIAAAEHISEGGASGLWESDAGGQLGLYLEDILQAADAVGEIETWSYTNFLRGLLAGSVYRPSYGSHASLAILTPQEAQLLDADCVILGGLNEGSWPAALSGDPWMSRAMRARFGLPPKEKEIGIAAQYFCQLFYMPEVVLTRARKVEGKPTLPSRWLLRLETLLNGAGLLDAIAPKQPWQQWAILLHEPESYTEIQPPAPVPPVESRPVSLSVTQVEKLLRDPYAIYASHILGLKPLPPLDQDISRADFGTVIHAILAQFINGYDSIPAGKHLEALLTLGRKTLRHYMEESPSAEVFWWSRFERIAEWFVTHTAERYQKGVRFLTECEGNIMLGDFQLKARADRIETSPHGISIIDYKTGGIPTQSEIEAGFACQMTLEAMIAEMGGFPVSGKVNTLEYWKLTGGEKPVEHMLVNEPAQRIETAKEGLARLLGHFARADTSYPSEPWPEYAPRFSDYRHLARVKEWG